MGDEGSFDRVEAQLADIQMHHYELVEMVGEYRALMEEVRDGGTPDQVALARGLPGARYRVKSEYIRQTWLQVEAELRKLFPRD